MRRSLHILTRRLPMIALAVLVCGLGGALPARGEHAPSERCPDAVRVARTGVTLHLIDRAGLPGETRRELMTETVIPWREAGVDVRWAADDPAGGGPEDLYVTLIRDGDDGTGAGTSGRPHGMGHPLASILFVDGQPTTQVLAHVTEVEALAAAARLDDRAWSDLPRLLRERMLGRALGRVIAHEVGHYLFASAAHAPSGLMRPHHPIERLLTSSAAPFQVIPPPSIASGWRIGSILGAP